MAALRFFSATPLCSRVSTRATGAASTSSRVLVARPPVMATSHERRATAMIVAARSNFDWEEELEWETDLEASPYAPAPKAGGKYSKKGKGKRGGYDPVAEVTSMNAMEDAMYEDSVVDKKVKRKPGKVKRRGGRGALTDDDYLVEREVDFTERSYA